MVKASCSSKRCEVIGWEAWTRTRIARVRVWSPTNWTTSQQEEQRFAVWLGSRAARLVCNYGSNSLAVVRLGFNFCTEICEKLRNGARAGRVSGARRDGVHFALADAVLGVAPHDAIRKKAAYPHYEMNRVEDWDEVEAARQDLVFDR